MYADGQKLAAIADAMGRSMSAVRGRLYGVVKPSRRRDWTKDEDRRLRDAVTLSQPVAEIARQLGRPVGAVRSRIARKMPKRSVLVEVPLDELRQAVGLPAGAQIIGARLRRGGARVELTVVG